MLCYLLGIQTEATLNKHAQYGAIFENWAITEIKKNRFNQGIEGGLYFFRDSAGNEVDLLMEKQDKTIAVEIKAGAKMDNSMLGGLKYWQKNNRDGSGILLYGGESAEILNDQMQVVGWKEIEAM